MFRMYSNVNQSRKLISVSLSLLLYVLMLPVVSSVPTVAERKVRRASQLRPHQLHQEPNIIVIAPGSAYRQTNFISDYPGPRPVLDPLLVNPWGISVTGSSPFWVANNGTSTTQLIRGDVPAGTPVVLNASPQTITIPGGLPTGTVANPTATDFVLPGACASAPCGANFLFASITGNITGWDPNAPAAGSTTAVIAASHPGHVYTGLAYRQQRHKPSLRCRLRQWHDRRLRRQLRAAARGQFSLCRSDYPDDDGEHLSPVQHPGDRQLALRHVCESRSDDGLDEEGVGNGFVRRFNTNGVRDLTFGINNGALNSPWGCALAPATFGIFGGALLIGNFGEGNPSIHAYNPTTGAFLGTLQDESGNGIVIDELWALVFGNGGAGGDVNTLYFTAGIGEEEHGLFGKLKPTTASATSLIQFCN